jgi:glutaredoxin
MFSSDLVAYRIDDAPKRSLARLSGILGSRSWRTPTSAPFEAPQGDDMDISLYALSTCPYCRMTKRYLDDHGITYKMIEVDQLEGDEKQSAIDKVKELSGGTSFPVLVADNEVVVGFNKTKIADILGL